MTGYQLRWLVCTAPPRQHVGREGASGSRPGGTAAGYGPDGGGPGRDGVGGAGQVGLLNDGVDCGVDVIHLADSFLIM